MTGTLEGKVAMNSVVRARARRDSGVGWQFVDAGRDVGVAGCGCVGPVVWKLACCALGGVG
jgi:hypothetical protein